MPYLVIEDFKGGLDYRRSRFASPPGTLYALRNAIITRGGEIESTKDFVLRHTFGAGVAHGLYSGADNVATFGSTSSVSVGSVPSGISYNELATGAGPAVAGMVGACQFSTNWFAIATLADASQKCFYNGAALLSTDPVQLASPFLRDCLTFKNNVYVLSATTLYRSKIGDPTTFDTAGTGAFAIDLAAAGMDSYGAVGLGLYEGMVVVFGRRQIQFWTMDPDPAKCVMVRQLSNVGAHAKRSISTYGDRDSFFLSGSGVRSLRIRDSSGAATVNDVGSAIDARTEPLMAYGGDEWQSAVEPKTGRYFLTLPDEKIVVYCRSDGISAWGEIEPGFIATNLATAGGRLWAKSGASIYRYGGDDDDEYGSVTPMVEMPFLDMGKPGTQKILHTLDATVEGAWRVQIACSTYSPDAWVTVAEIDGPTFDMLRIPVGVTGTHFALRFTGIGAPGRRRLSNIILHYDLGEAG